MNKKVVAALALSAAVLVAGAASANTMYFKTRPTISGKVVAHGGSPAVAKAGMEILLQGGTAFDAAMAMAAAQSYSEVMMCHIFGGDLQLIGYDAKAKKVFSFNGTGWAPKKASIDFHMEKTNAEIPVKGIYSMHMPGEWSGWMTFLAKYGTMPLDKLLAPAEKMARMNTVSYDRLRSLSRGKFSPQQFLSLKSLAANTVGVNNSIFDTELCSLLTLYKATVEQICILEVQITELIGDVHPHYMSIPGIGPISAAIIYAEYGDISNFSKPSQMLAFAGLEPGVNDSGTESHGGKMVKRGSSQLRYVLMNCALPLIRFDMTFAAYYAKKRAEGKPHRVALSHVAKKLVRVIFALERQNADFVAQALR